MSRSAAIVIIGNEILTGKVTDENTPFLTRELWELGVEVGRVVVIPDVVDVIAEEVSRASAGWEFVLTSGGVGPTHDDVTMEGVARAFGRTVVRNPVLEGMLLQFYGSTALTEAQGRLAEVPEGARVVLLPGVKYPQVVMENVYIFPGIPDLLRQKFRAVRETFRDEPFRIRKILCRADETTLAPFLNLTVSRFPQVAIGSYPRAVESGWEVLITLESKDVGALEEAYESLRGQFPPDQIRLPDEAFRSETTSHPSATSSV